MTSSSLISASGNPSSYAATGLPPGLTITSSYEYIGGTPTAPGTYPVTISESDASGTSSAVITFIVTNPAPAFTNLAAAVSGVVNAPFRTAITATNTPANYAASGLPAGGHAFDLFAVRWQPDGAFQLRHRRQQCADLV